MYTLAVYESKGGELSDAVDFNNEWEAWLVGRKYQRLGLYVEVICWKD